MLTHLRIEWCRTQVERAQGEPDSFRYHPSILLVMHFVALVSGGKDSCFNVMKCIESGHTLACIANLYPANQDEDDINSFMYQSAGHSVIPLYAECFGVPLYRRPITGTAVSQSIGYEMSIGDEVEDLYCLLKDIIKEYPEIKGVSCGAIVSNYQRLRVENVCIRLSLTPLSYLWMRDRETLLQDIVSSGVSAVLVKVAGAGLDPYKHLGKSLDQLLPTLHKLHEKYGLDLCGEGGEYETLVLDCPAFIARRMELVETEVLSFSLLISHLIFIHPFNHHLHSDKFLLFCKKK